METKIPVALAKKSVISLVRVLEIECWTVSRIAPAISAVNGAHIKNFVFNCLNGLNSNKQRTKNNVK